MMRKYIQRDFYRDAIYEITDRYDEKKSFYAICLANVKDEESEYIPFTRGGKKFRIHRKYVGNEIIGNEIID